MICVYGGINGIYNERIIGNEKVVCVVRDQFLRTRQSILKKKGIKTKLLTIFGGREST